MAEKSKEVVERRRPRETVRAFVLAIALALGIRTFVVEPFKIPSGSMIPTLLVGDHIFVNKFVYGLRMPFTGSLVIPMGQPERGDVIVFRYPDDPTQDFIKRCIGLPGDTIEIRGERVYLNGQVVDRIDRGRYEYMDYERVRDVEVRRQDEILPNEAMLGDNRDSSRDSRFWRNPFVRADQIKGRATFIYWSWVVSEGPQKERGIIGDLLFTLYRVVTLQIEDIRWDRVARRVNTLPD
jgi:signal peptidase I